MNTCSYCMGTEFILLDGYYFCGQCNIQSQEAIQEDFSNENAGGFSGRLQIRSKKDRTKHEKNYGKPWTTYDAFNLILVSQVDSLLSLGVSSELKPLVSKLWLIYLHKIKLTCVKNPKYNVKLQTSLKKRDLFILFRNGSKIPSYRKETRKVRKRIRNRSAKSKRNGSKPVTKRKKMRTDTNEMEINQDTEPESAISESEVESETSVRERFNDYAYVSRKVIDRFRKKRVDGDVSYMTLPRTIAFVYLGLLLLREQILLCDLIRWTWEGRIPYYNASVDILPNEMVFQMYDSNTFRVQHPLTNDGIRKETSHLAAYLDIKELPSLPLQYIAARFIKELDLPAVMHSYVNNLINMHPPKMKWVFDERKKLIPHIPNYECRAMSFIVVALKLLFGINDVDEWKISKYVDTCKKKDIFGDEVPFVYRDWIKVLNARHELQQLTWHRSIRGKIVDRPVDVDSLAWFYANDGNGWRGRPTLKTRARNNQYDSVWNTLCEPFLALIINDNNQKLLKVADIKPSSFPFSADIQYFKNSQFSPENTTFRHTSLDYVTDKTWMSNLQVLKEDEQLRKHLKKFHRQYRRNFKCYRRYSLNSSISGQDRDFMICLANPISNSFLMLLKLVANVIELKPAGLYKEVVFIETMVIRKNGSNRGRNLLEARW